MNDHSLTREKTLNALLFIFETLGGAWDLYASLKMLYFAEQKHLVKYGRPITGDTIIAMKYGPVPYMAYSSLQPAKLNKEYFETEGYVVSAKQKANLDYLSESDIKCLLESIDENKHLGFGQIKWKSHDASYEKIWNTLGENAVIPFFEIAQSGGATEELMKYIKINIENDRLVL